MSFANRDSEEFADLTIRDLRSGQTAQQSAIFESNFIRFEKDAQNSPIQAKSNGEDETSSSEMSSSNSSFPGCSETSKMDKSCKTQKNPEPEAMSNKDSSSEIEGFVCEQIYEYKCKAVDQKKTPPVQTDGEKLQDSDSSGAKFPTGYLNISSDSHGSIENLNSSESNDDGIKLITDADEPPTKRGKNNFKVILVQIK